MHLRAVRRIRGGTQKLQSKRMKTLKHLFFFLTLTLLAAAPAGAATVTVTSSADGYTAGTLRQVVLDANPGDVVNFDSALSG